MKIAGAVVVATGAASGIGLAMARRFVREGARAVVVADIAEDTEAVAREIGAHGALLDVTSGPQTQALVDRCRSQYGEIDLFCANAGILVQGGVEVPDEQWRRIMDLNLMAHVQAARALLPAWTERRKGYLLHTVSAAALLTGPTAAPYTVSKHALLGLVEWMSIEYRDRGITFSALCPQGVRTPMMSVAGDATEALLGPSAMTAEAVAQAVVEGLDRESFLILPHPEVLRFAQRKVADIDIWLDRMTGLRRALDASIGESASQSKGIDEQVET